MRVVVLGAGLIGRPMAKDLAEHFETSIVDRDVGQLNLVSANNLQKIVLDLSDEKGLEALLDSFDFAINAVPGFMGYKTLETIIRSGTSGVDIAFCPEDVLQLDGLAKANGVCVISDMGVAPGMSNLLAAHLAKKMDRPVDLRIYVGGLPKNPTWPYRYKAPFSPIDVIEEYTRPARIVKDGKIVTMEALSEVEKLEFEPVGILEAFNSDGLRSLIHTLDIPNMVEKTLRYPGHAKLMRVLRDTGFFRKDIIDVKGRMLRPIDLTSTLLFENWKLEPSEPEFTVMHIVLSGQHKNKSCTMAYRLYDEYNPETGVHSMARTTGYAATSVLRMMVKGLFNNPGVHVPEFLADENYCVDFILGELSKRGINYRFVQDED